MKELYILSTMYENDEGKFEKGIFLTSEDVTVIISKVDELIMNNPSSFRCLVMGNSVGICPEVSKERYFHVLVSCENPTKFINKLFSKSKAKNLLEEEGKIY